MSGFKPLNQKLIPSKQSPFIPIIPIPQSHSILQVPTNTIKSEMSENVEECYRNYIKIFRDHRLLKTQLNRVLEEKGELEKKYNLLQTDKSEQDEKKKRHRRNAHEIARDYHCPIDSCQKSYGAQASLIQHIKLKHEEYFNTPAYEDMIRNLPKKQINEPQNQSQ